MKQLLEILKADFELEELGAGEFSKIKVNGMNFTINRAGTYRFKWCCMKPAVSLGGSGTSASALFKNGTMVSGTENTSFSDNTHYQVHDIACAAGDVISIREKHGGSMYATYIYGVSVHIDWSPANGFIK